MVYRTLWVLAGLIFVGVSGIAHAQSAGVVCAYGNLIGSVQLPGSGRSVAVDGDRAYIAAGSVGLQILDISDPSDPVLLSTFSVPFENESLDVAISGEHAILAEGRRGMRVVDISDPEKPRLVTTFTSSSLGTRLYAIEILDDIAYLANGDDALNIVDISNPETPELMANCGHNGAVRDVVVSGGVAYLAVGDLGVEIFDVSDPHNPLFLGAGTQGILNAVGVEIAGVHLYVSDSYGGLKILNIVDPVKPVLVGQIDQESAQQTQVIRDRAYVSAGDRLVIYDISDPAHPREIGVNEIHRAVRNMFIREGVAFIVGGSDDGMRIVDVTDPSSSSLVASLGSYGDLWRPNALSVEGPAAFVGSSRGEMRAVDLSNPKQPVVSSIFRTRTDFGDSIRDLKLRDGFLYLAKSESGLAILDVSNPLIPQLLGSFDIGRATYGIELQGDVAYLCSINTGLWAIDVSDPDVPVLLDRYAENSWIYSVSAFGSYLFVPEVDPLRLSVLDASNPSDLRLVGEVALPSGAGKAVFANGYAYLPAGEYLGIHIVNIKDPQNPVYAGSFGGGGRVHQLAVRGDRLFVADYFEGLCVYDISVPEAPRQVGLYGRTWSVEYVGLMDDFAVIADSNFGIEIINISENCNDTCLPDTNNDGSLTPADFSSWVAAFNSNLPACDQNSDGSCTPADFSAWVANYNAGCQ